MKLNTRGLSRFLTRWCKANGFEVSVRYGADFAYYFNQEVVRYALLSDDMQDKLFLKVFADEGLVYVIEKNYEVFICSFFHELGHYMTDDEWSDDESNKFMEFKSTLDGTTKKGNMDYFYTDDEIRATRWAVDYINNHGFEIDELVEELKYQLHKIYDEFGLDKNENIPLK